MTPHLEILPPGQRLFWDEMAKCVPEPFVLYGGTAVALRHGHRSSVDFDYFSDQPLDHAALHRALPVLDGGQTLQKGPDAMVALVPIGGDEVKLSFFGGIGFGRVGEPDRIAAHAVLASPLDLLATKLKALHDRIEAKDYLDIEVLLRNGLTLTQGISASMALFGRSLNPYDTAKAVAWFKDGGLEQSLPLETRRYLGGVVASFDPLVMPARILSRRLATSIPGRD